MSGGVLGLVQKVVTAHAHIRAQSVPFPVLWGHMGVGGTCLFERIQSRMQVICVAEAEQWLGAVEGTLSGPLVGCLGVAEAAFPEAGG